MGFGTEQQLGNRQTSLADLFRNNIGAPQPTGTTQQPNQLFDLLQRLLGGGGGDAGQVGLPTDPGGGNTMLSSITAEPMGGGFQRGGGGGGLGGFGGVQQGTQLTNPFGSLIDQKFIR